jgi:FkbM family methyltransferase
MVDRKKISVYKIILRIPEVLKMIFNSIVIFRDPLNLWKSYLNITKPPGNYYDLRSGYRIFLSENNHDSITVMVIFCRKEYGKINKDSSIIDIGANIGVFSLYAMWSGAKKCYSVEPNLKSFQVLQKNIDFNKLKDKVVLYNNAISSINDNEILIPIESSPYNKQLSVSSDTNKFQKSMTITLNKLLFSNNIHTLDLLKIDCEGAEYDLLYNCEDYIFSQTIEIRMEHHLIQEKNNLLKFICDHGFVLEQDCHMILWFKKK